MCFGDCERVFRSVFKIASVDAVMRVLMGVISAFGEHVIGFRNDSFLVARHVCFEELCDLLCELFCELCISLFFKDDNN